MPHDLREGKILNHLIRLTAPMLIGITAGMSFNLIDTYFVGKLGIDQLTAISFTFPVVLMVLNLSIGIAIGTNSVLSRLLGSGEEESVSALSGLIVVASLFGALLIWFLGVSTIEPIFLLIGAQKKHIPYIKEYMVYAYPAMAIRMVSVSLSGTFRAYGITVIPSAAIFITAIVNVILDPLLIFGSSFTPALGIAGAGLATLLSNIISFSFELFIGIFHYKFFNLSFVKLIQDPNTKERILTKVKEILGISLPAALSNALNPLSLNIINFFIATYLSTVEVAGFGVATRLQFFSMIPLLALSAAVGPVVGQNFGSQNKERVREVINTSLIIALVWGAVQILILYFFGKSLSMILANEEGVALYSSEYLRTISFSLWGYSVVIVLTSALNAVNKPLMASGIIFTRTIGFLLIFLWFFQFLNISNFILWAIFAANICSAALSYRLIRSCKGT